MPCFHWLTSWNQLKEGLTLMVGYGAQPKALLFCDPFIDTGGLNVEDYSLWQYNPLSA